MNQQCNAIIANSGVSFGTSGARGLVEQFSDDVCAAFTVAFLHVMREHGDVQQVAIGMDRRPSSPRMAAACTAAARAMGVEVSDYGILPTPALALQAMAHGVPAIMMTGSHIPFDRNGIKFYRPQGEITKADEQAILNVGVELPTLGQVTRNSESDAANQRYIMRFTNWFEGKPLTGMRVGLYQHSAAGRDLSQQVLEALGASVIPLGRSEQFVPVDTEAVSEEDRAKASSWSIEHSLDAILTTDGDGDRPLLADEHGQWLRGDILGLLCAQALGIQALAIPVSCNTAIEECGIFEQVIRTRIGSPYVLAGMEALAGEYHQVSGFEANGGFLLGSSLKKGNCHLDPLPTRDALLPALTLLVAAAGQNQPLSALVNALPLRFTASDRLKEFPTELSATLLSQWKNDLLGMRNGLALEADITHVDSTDGLRVTLKNGDIIHLRPSGNAPELRCYAESDTSEQAALLAEKSLAACAFFLKSDPGRL